MTLQAELLKTLKDYPDFPKPGIIFKDICPLLADAALFKKVIQNFAENVRATGADKIVGIESRGFLFGVPLAQELGLPFVPARKKGKLPGKVVSQSYALEYGEDQIEMQAETLTAGSKFYVIDDVVATGGTAAAVGQLIQKQNATVAGYGFLIELSFLNSAPKLKNLSPKAQIHSILIL